MRICGLKLPCILINSVFGCEDDIYDTKHQSGIDEILPLKSVKYFSTKKHASALQVVA